VEKKLQLAGAAGSRVRHKKKGKNTKATSLKETRGAAKKGGGRRDAPGRGSVFLVFGEHHQIREPSATANPSNCGRGTPGNTFARGTLKLPLSQAVQGLLGLEGGGEKIGAPEICTVRGEIKYRPPGRGEAPTNLGGGTRKVKGIRTGNDFGHGWFIASTNPGREQKHLGVRQKMAVFGMGEV